MEKEGIMRITHEMNAMYFTYIEMWLNVCKRCGVNSPDEFEFFHPSYIENKINRVRRFMMWSRYQHFLLHSYDDRLRILEQYIKMRLHAYRQNKQSTNLSHKNEPSKPVMVQQEFDFNQ